MGTLTRGGVGGVVGECVGDGVGGGECDVFSFLNPPADWYELSLRSPHFHVPISCRVSI